jgi:hypothetical protein
MPITHIEFASDVTETTCPGCGQDAVREAVLVNRYGLILARGTTCLHCGHTRHKAGTRKHGGMQVDSAA